MKLRYIAIAGVFLALAANQILAADAKENWQKNCAKCHGVDGKGHTKMGEKLHVKDYTDSKVQSEMKDEKMADTIKNGVKADDGKVRMKPHGDILSADEIKGLVQFVRAFKK